MPEFPHPPGILSWFSSDMLDTHVGLEGDGLNQECVTEFSEASNMHCPEAVTGKH